MYSIMIVDDEKMFREAFVKVIPWSKYGFEIIAVQNGEEAIEVLRTKKCDVVFSDIEMPVVDGIQLMDFIYKNYPETIIIALSCYSEFEYAQAALQRGAKDYVTKLSITPKSMESLLHKLRGMVEKAESEKKKKQIVDEQFRLNLEAGIRRIIVDNDPKSYESLQEYADMSSVNFMQAYDAAIYVEGERKYTAELENMLLADQDRSEEAVMRIVISETEKLFLIHENADEYLNILDGAGEIAANIRIDAYTKHFRIEELRNIFKNYFYPRKELDFFFDTPLFHIPEGEAVPRNSEDLKTFISIYREWCSNVYFKGYRQFIFDKYSSARDLKKKVIEAVYYVLERARQILEDKTGTSEIQVGKLDQICRLSELNELFGQDYYYFVEKISNFEWGSISDPIRRVILHIQEQHCFTMTLNEGAELAHMAPQYFSVQFKKQTGSGFLQYLNQLKIEYAKELLLKTDMKIYEVGMAIGIDNEGYFSRFFKNHIGMSPYKYRNRDY